MDLLQAAMAPVEVGYGPDVTLRIPKFTLDDIITMSSSIMNARLETQTKGMDEGQRMQYVTFYPPLEPDMQEVKRYVRTAPGMRYVCETCLKRATRVHAPKDGSQPQPDRPLTAEEVAAVLRLGTSRLGPLAWALADLEERPLVPPQKTGADDAEETRGNS